MNRCRTCCGLVVLGLSPWLAQSLPRCHFQDRVQVNWLADWLCEALYRRNALVTGGA
ncbi:MAG: hypothetical protein Q6K59_09590 [Gloeomargarita sp. GMQP_bins_25]